MLLGAGPPSAPMRWYVSLWIPVVWLGCARPPDLKPLQLNGISPPVQNQILEAHRKASANPKDAVSNARLGMILQAYQRWEAAETAYHRALARDPRSFEWLYYLGVVQQEQQHDAPAADSFRQALILRPKDPDARSDQTR